MACSVPDARHIQKTVRDAYPTGDLSIVQNALPDFDHGDCICDNIHLLFNSIFPEAKEKRNRIIYVVWSQKNTGLTDDFS